MVIETNDGDDQDNNSNGRREGISSAVRESTMQYGVLELTNPRTLHGIVSMLRQKHRQSYLCFQNVRIY